MKFSLCILSAVAASVAVANPIPDRDWKDSCISDEQADYLVQSFKSVLTNPNRTAAGVTAQMIIADGYVETSDSINSLAGYPLGGPSFVGKQSYIGGITHAPAIGSMQDLLIEHSCYYITWYWLAHGIGTNAQEVKGINIFKTTEDFSQILTDNLEFNSIAWGIDDMQVTNTPPPPPSG